jgi:hypothetical protein
VTYFLKLIPIALRSWSSIDPLPYLFMLYVEGSPVGLSAVQDPGLNLLHPGIAPRCLRTSFKMLLSHLVIVFGWVFFVDFEKV